MMYQPYRSAFKVDELSLIFLSLSFFLVFEITPSNKASSKPKSIDEIDDIREMLELMTSLKVSHTGCQTLDESRVRLKEEMARNTNRTLGNEVRIFNVVHPE